jgi:hypothetical protein
MVWLMYTTRAKIAEVLGEDPKPFYIRADEIKKTMYSILWNEEGGFFYDTWSENSRGIPTAIAPAIYHPIEFGMVEEDKAERMLDYLLGRLTSIDGMVRVDDWFPINWSHNVFSPMETANAAIAAYTLRKKDIGCKLLKGVIRGAFYKAVVPGSISCHSSSTGITKNGTDFGDGVSLFMKAVVEGLFGIHMNLPGGSVSISPNFPAEWDRAEISLPDFKSFTYFKKSSEDHGRIEIKLVPGRLLKVNLSLPVSGTVEKISVNGTECSYELGKKQQDTIVSLDAGVSHEYLIIAEYVPYDEKRSENEERTKVLPSAETGRRNEKAVLLPLEAVPCDEHSYEYVSLDSCVKISFSDIWKVFPQELNWHLDNFGSNWLCEFDGSGCTGNILTAENGIPFRVDGLNAAAVRKKYETRIWKGKGLCKDIPEVLRISVDRPADKIYLLMSGLCSPMTCYLPQLSIELVYEDSKEQFCFSSPGGFDFITQHVTSHPAVHMGWFGTENDLDRMKNHRDENFIDFDPLNMNGVQQLHADVICLGAAKGILKEIILRPLANQSGVILHGITLFKGLDV